jgi:hypothetical protein
MLITDECPMCIQSREEVKDVISLHFGIRKHRLYVYKSSPDPFVVVFSERHDHDVVFAVASAVEGPIEHGFHAWDLD